MLVAHTLSNSTTYRPWRYSHVTPGRRHQAIISAQKGSEPCDPWRWVVPWNGWILPQLKEDARQVIAAYINAEGRWDSIPALIPKWGTARELWWRSLDSITNQKHKLHNLQAQAVKAVMCREPCWNVWKPDCCRIAPDCCHSLSASGK